MAAGHAVCRRGRRAGNKVVTGGPENEKTARRHPYQGPGQALRIRVDARCIGDRRERAGRDRNGRGGDAARGTKRCYRGACETPSFRHGGVPAPRRPHRRSDVAFQSVCRLIESVRGWGVRITAATDQHAGMPHFQISPSPPPEASGIRPHPASRRGLPARRPPTPCRTRCCLPVRGGWARSEPGRHSCVFGCEFRSTPPVAKCWTEYGNLFPARATSPMAPGMLC